MKRSEKLFQDGKVEVLIYSTPKICTIIPDIKKGMRYVGTDFDAICNGRRAWVDIYECDMEDGFYGLVEFIEEDERRF